MRDAAAWVEQLWRAAAQARQVLLAYAEAGDARARAAYDALVAVLDGEGRK
jgi:hypothetical protein